MVLLAHQGDTEDYQNLIALAQHADILTERLKLKVHYIDDVAGPAAQELVSKLKPGQVALLGNLRYLCEEVSFFEKVVPLRPKDMQSTFLIRQLAPLADFYVNDAFSAAHRCSPSMVGFQELLPSAGGRQLIAEYNALTKVLQNPRRPAVFLLGGRRVADAFAMLNEVLDREIGDLILVGGVIGILFQMARGAQFGTAQEAFVKKWGMEAFLHQAVDLHRKFGSRIVCPCDFAYNKNGTRAEARVGALPLDALFMDIGGESIRVFRDHLTQAGTIFVNGPVGAYENPLFDRGTKELWSHLASVQGYTVVGGGDSVSAAYAFIADADEKLGYICTAGGAMVRFISGSELPLITALKKAFRRTYS